MNTPLMELIATLSEYYYSETFPNSEKSGIKLSIDCAVQLLEKEREVIEKAYVAGADTIIYHRDLGHDVICKQDYYTKTFTNESK